MNHPEVTEQALSILRSGDPFQWYVITLLALYGVHWFFKILNALIQHFRTVYIPFFLAAFTCYDWHPRTQVRFFGAVFALNALLLAVFAGGLGWNSGFLRSNL